MTTYHGMIRVCERAKCSTDLALRMIENASIRGKDASAFASWEHNYLKTQGEKQGNCRAVAYNGFCFIFGGDGLCVTMYKLPRWFGKKKHFDGKTKIRKMKKYYRNYAVHS